MAQIRIGVSGWSYRSWRGSFYPDGLPRSEELAYAGGVFDTLEVNGTFYSLQKPATFRDWARSVPDDFRFALKGSRYITHDKKLKDPRPALGNFLASGLLALGRKLGPVLWQFPNRFGFDPERLDSFLGMLPKDTDGAARLARHHDERTTDVLVVPPDDNHRIRHAVEPRDASWFVPELAAILRRHGIALAISHASEWTWAEEITAGFVYLRLHGPGKVYASRYSDDDLDCWAARIRTWSEAGEPGDARRITDRSPPARKERDV